MRLIATITGAAGLVIANGLWATVVLLIAIFERRGVVWWPFGRLWARTIFWGCLSSIRPRGFDQLGWDQGAIMMCNHQSHFDVPALIASCPVPVRFVARHNLFWVPVLGQAMWATGMVSVNRSNREQAISSLSRAANEIRGGKMVLLFPEGTRSDDGEVLPFKKGGFMLALDSQVPIFPVGIAGTGRMLPKRWSWMNPGVAAVVVGDPIETAGLGIEDREALMLQVRQAILALKIEAEAML